MKLTELKRWSLFLSLGLIVVLLASCARADTMFVGGKEYPLDPNIPAVYQYIAKEDPLFEWHDLPHVQPVNNTEKRYVSYRVEFTSQQWLTPKEVDRSVWKHNLTIIVPYEVEFAGAVTMYITGCHNDDEKCPDKERGTVDEILTKTNSVLAVLTQIPQQKMTFADGVTRGEDFLVAHTWAQFVRNPTRPDWIVYMPAAKAAVMAQKVLHQWSKQNPDLAGPTPFSKFYFAGASKRGAVTWLTAAYMGHYFPQNIIGAAPMVFDTLNFTHTVPAMHQQLGGWTMMFKDYGREGIVDVINDPVQSALLAKHIDPLTAWYAPGLDAVAKLVVSATGDEFFLPTNDRYYYRQLKNKMRLQIPNTDHILLTGLDYVYNGIAGHFRQLVQGKPLPQWHHTMDYATNTITLLVSPKPTSVSVFKANTPPAEVQRMDFRMIKRNIEGGCLPPSTVINEEICFNPTWWEATPLVGEDLQSSGWRYTYTAAEHEIPQNGTYFGFVILAAWENHPTMGNQVYSTQVNIANSEKYPFPDCRPNCEIILV